MTKPFKGVVNLDIRDSTPDWEPFMQPQAPEGAPNVLMIVWDDVGYGAMDVFGGPIETPTMRGLADAGIRYSNFHTTALCSPTRSSLLNGRNATSNNMACITEASAGFPGFSARIPFENGTIAEVLNERGWNTYCIGKWHLTPGEETDMSSWKGRWPLGRGFERFYGFLGGETNQWYPTDGVTGPDGQPWPQLDFVRPWGSLSDDEKRFFARMAEVYAGFVSYTDHEIGRFLDYLEDSGQLENTIVVVVSENARAARAARTAPSTRTSSSTTSLTPSRRT
jgi:arylsulfatase A-like enzyme